MEMSAPISCSTQADPILRFAEDLHSRRLFRPNEHEESDTSKQSFRRPSGTYAQLGCILIMKWLLLGLANLTAAPHVAKWGVTYFWTSHAEASVTH